MPTPKLRDAFAALATCAACNLAHSAEWSAQPSYWLYMDYDSNRRLAPEGEQADEAAWLTLDLLLRRLSESDELDIHPQLQLQRFTKDAALDSDNGSLQLAATHRGELWTVAAKAAWSRASTLITELSDTGIIDANTHQDSLGGELSASRELSARQRLDADVSYADVTYPDGLRVGLVGYDYSSASFSYVYALSERSSLSAIAFGSDVLSVTSARSQDAGMRLQWVYAYSARTTLTASAGSSQARIGGADGTGTVWDFEFAQQLDRGKWNFSINRDVEPNGRGLLISHEEADLSMNRSVAPHLYITLLARGIHNEDLISGLDLDDRRYFAGEAGFEWHTSPQWVINFVAGYSEATTYEPYQVAHGWRSAITIRWTPLPWTISR
jgi:hypothetical protein